MALISARSALSSCCASFPLHHQQHQPEPLLSALCHIRRPPGSNIGALHGVALTASSIALLTHHQQHQPEPLLSALCHIRRPPGSNIGALLGVALSLFSFSLPKYLEHLLDSYSSSPNRYALDAFDVRLWLDGEPLRVLSGDALAINNNNGLRQL